MKKLILILLLIPGMQSYEQDSDIQNIRSTRRFGIQAQLGGLTLLPSLQADYFLTHNLNIEAGFSLLAMYIGPKWYFGSAHKLRRWSVYSGVTYALPYGDMLDGAVYVPAGIQFLGKKGLTASIEGAAFYHPEAYSIFTAALKIGYHF
jgi:hypothetical protein